MSDTQTLEQDETHSICGEWWKSDRGDAVGWGASFIWGGLVLIAEVSGYSQNFSWWDGWGMFFSGAGVITLAIAAIRLLVTRQRSKAIGGLIFGSFLLAIGLGEVAAWLWPLLLISFGLFILLSAFRPGKGS
jgi:hypothetical protein